MSIKKGLAEKLDLLFPLLKITLQQHSLVRYIFTPTGFPLCIPGFILGSKLMTLVASFCSLGCGAATLTSMIFPVLSILKSMVNFFLPGNNPSSLGRFASNFFKKCCCIFLLKQVLMHCCFLYIQGKQGHPQSKRTERLLLVLALDHLLR